MQFGRVMIARKNRGGSSRYRRVNAHADKRISRDNSVDFRISLVAVNEPVYSFLSNDGMRVEMKYAEAINVIDISRVARFDCSSISNLRVSLETGVCLSQK